jgi:hypothetical protein
MSAPVPQQVYDAAAAVFSRSFRFVEWKLVIAAKGTSTPFGDREVSQQKATRKIDRLKWIYVFRNNHEREVYAEIVEEIRIDRNGEMAATPSDKIERELKTRGDPVSLGKTMCLPRRMFGKPLVYRFYASRVRLPLAQIKELKSKITAFAPPVILDPDPGKNLSVIEQNGELLVPVIDPLTVALHLHAAFTAAADDIINYTVPHKENENRGIVERRRKKHLLATLLKSIIGEADNTGANNLIHELAGMQGPLEEFLAHYEAQVQRRVERRDRLGAFLTRWLDSDALRIVADAYRGHPKANWAELLVPWCHAITRLGESPPGRQYLDALLENKTHFIYTYVWPENALPADAVQAVRKSGMTIFEAWKTLAERKILVKGGTVHEIIASLQILLVPTGKRTLTRTIKSVGMIAPDSVETVRHFASEPKAFGAIIESVNFILAIGSTMREMKTDDPRKKELAIIGLVGSSLDAASAIGTLLEKSEKVVATLGFVSGVIDVYLGHQEMRTAFKAGDQDVANASFLTVAGSAIGTAGTLMALTAIPGGQIAAVAGLLVVAMGFIYKSIAGKDPIERFFAHCTWGKEHQKPGQPDWSPTDFKDWRGDKEFDHQLQALLNIICRIEISHGDTYRDLKYKMGWLPPDSKLEVKYEEAWSEKAHDRAIEGAVVFEAMGPRSLTPAMAASADGRNGVKIVIGSGALSKKSPHMDMKVGDVRLPNRDLRKSVASGRLLVTFDGTASVTIPDRGWAKKTFFER